MQTKQPKAAKTLVNDVFEVKEKDPDGKKFDKGLTAWRLQHSGTSIVGCYGLDVQS